MALPNTWLKTNSMISGCSKLKITSLGSLSSARRDLPVSARTWTGSLAPRHAGPNWDSLLVVEELSVLDMISRSVGARRGAVGQREVNVVQGRLAEGE